MEIGAATSLHQAGKRAEAQAAYQQILARNPDHDGALHGLGVLLDQSGQHAEAAALLERATALAPAQAVYHFNLGLARLRAGNPGLAAEALQQAARLNPGWPEAQYDLGNALRAAGQAEAAQRAFRAALKLHPEYLEAEVNLANLLRLTGKTEQAISAYQRLLRRHPRLAELHNNLACALLDAGKPAEAESHARMALSLRGDFPEARATLAHALRALERHAEAAGIAATCLAERPGDGAMLELRAACLQASGQHEEAEAAYIRLQEHSPSLASARFGQAEALRSQKRFAEAEAILTQLAADYPQSWEAQHDLANVLRDQGHFAAAETVYRAALDLAENAHTLTGLAASQRDLGQPAEAEPLLRRALKRAPNDADVRYNLAVTQLSLGRLADGFALYDARFSRFKPRLPPGTPWQGGNPRGKRLLIACEQGLGDTIQFARYLAPLARAGAEISLLAPPPLHRLLATLQGPARILGPGDAAPQYDHYAMLMSLPRLLQIATPNPIPVPYLAADPAATEAWRTRLAPLPRPWVGIAWAGNKHYPADHLRSIAAPLLAPLAQTGASLISLQKGETPPAFITADWTAELADFADTAALVAALDVVISIDSAVAHLSGAIGQQTWLLNRFDSDWRWQFGTADGIWYPSLRQFRQTAPLDWPSAIAQAADALRHWQPAHG